MREHFFDFLQSALDFADLAWSLVSEPTDPRGFLYSRWFWVTILVLLAVDILLIRAVLH